MSTHTSTEKPFLRGHFHQAGFFFALGAGTLLIAEAPDSRTRIAAIIYTLCLAALFGFSSLYHRIGWSEKARIWLRRLDHATIFIFIAGTATPICLIGLDKQLGTQVLFLFWAAAIAGVLKELFWTTAPRWIAPILYILMGWLATPYVVEFHAALGTSSTWLLVIGGLVYTVGALIYGFKWPDPYPRIFGYHEIFHVFVMVAAAFHFIVIYRLVNR